MSMDTRMTARFWDKIARYVISAGGVTLILAVLAILLFIMKEALPLVRSSRVQSPEVQAHEPQLAASLATGIDDFHEVQFSLAEDELVFFQRSSGEIVDRHPLDLADSTDSSISVAHYDAIAGDLTIATDSGEIVQLHIDFDVRWDDTGRRIVPNVSERHRSQWPGAIRRARTKYTEDGEILCGVVTSDEQVHYLYVDKDGEETRLDLTAHLPGAEASALTFLVPSEAFVVGTTQGTLYFFNLSDLAEPELEDHIQVDAAAIRSMEALLGGQTLLVGDDNGNVSVWFRVRYVRAINEGNEDFDIDGKALPPGSQLVMLDRNYGSRFAHKPDIKFITAGSPWKKIRSFSVHENPVVDLAASTRDKSFASLDSEGVLALHHSTSHRNLLEVRPGIAGGHGLVFAPKSDGLSIVDGEGRIHFWKLDNPHPEAGWQALFGKVWYEGYSEPEYVWQSTGGSAEFEPKLSMVPLFFGTLKGTLYAMIFSVPISILGALYLSQLATPGLRNSVKPLVEMMAAIPSVVVGFLAALWLAPILEDQLASILGVLALVPLGMIAAMLAFIALPQGYRQRMKPGVELLFMLPFLGLVAWIGSSLGDPIERTFFGGDFQQWLYTSNGIHYDQRNCIVVGIALGFAVIPIIFSICEDAMSSVPRSLTSAALALGANRWQTALYIILPAASPGIFAAVMLGLGRAIGETMIVLMATGNTPIIDWSVFNGMRTMSAAIAVEIPEAPHGGTLYRVLFLTGTLLFAATFIINTGADLISRVLRKKYAQF